MNNDFQIAKIKNNKNKYLLIILTTFAVIGILIIGFRVCLLFGIIKECKYMKVNDNNREEIVQLLSSQKPHMFNNSKDVDLDECIKSVKKVELEFLFPHGEDYRIYCDGNKYDFSLNYPENSLSNYIYNNGKTRYRLRKWK